MQTEMMLDERIKSALAAKDHAGAGQLALRLAGRLPRAEASRYFVLAAECFFLSRDLPKAVRAAQQAADRPEALKVLALAFSLQHRSEQARAALARFEAAASDPLASSILRGLVLRNLGASHFSEARKALEQALKFDPSSIQARVNLALILCFLRQKEAARAEIETLRTDPRTRGSMELQLVTLCWLNLIERYDDALECIRTSLVHMREDPVVLRIELNAAIRTGRVGLARERLELLAKQPGNEDLCLRARTSLARLAGDHPALAEIAEQSLALSERADMAGQDVRSTTVALELGFSARAWQAYTRWRQDYEADTRYMPALGMPWYCEPHWPPPGKAACVIECPQGLGDFLMFMRWLPQAVARAPGRRFILRVPDALYPLLSRSVDVENVRLQRLSETVHGIDNAVLLDQLPHLLASPQPPAPWPLLKPLPEHVERVRTARKYPERPLVVVAWQGNPRQPMDEGRSLPPAALEPLLAKHAAGEIELFSIQQNTPEVLARRMTIMNGLDEPTPFEDSLAAMSLAQVTVTTDTSLAHLAGLAAINAELLLQYFSEWRWGLDDHNRWYPQQKLLRQDKPGDWASALAKMAMFQ